MIEAGHATFEQLREDVPDVFEVPAFKDYLAARVASGNMPKAKRGKRRNAEQHAAKRELFCWPAGSSETSSRLPG